MPTEIVRGMIGKDSLSQECLKNIFEINHNEAKTSPGFNGLSWSNESISVINQRGRESTKLTYKALINN